MKNKKILIVDDEKDILEPLSILLEAEGFLVKIEQNGENIFSSINKFNPDLILLDILMSGSDGRIICKKLKKDKKNRYIPIVMMSAHPSGETDSVESDADDFISKPFEIDEVVNTIRRNIKD
jgi:DNA-binding response OmpR family regulator